MIRVNRRAGLLSRTRSAAYAAIVLCLAGFPGHAETVTVSSFGQGRTQQDAIDKALIQAVEQVSGVRMQASRAISQSLTSTMDARSGDSTRISESFQQQLAQHSVGTVKAFEIVSVEPDTDGFKARLSVSIERFAAPGLPTQDRRRIVVSAPVNLAGLSAAEVAVFRDAMDAYLVQSRRFAILDRQNEAAYRAEMNLLRSNDVPAAEAARIGQIIGADYTLLTKVRRLETESRTAKMPVTGQIATRTSTQTAVDFSIMEIATRQVKWAGQISMTTAEGRDASLRTAAARVGEKIVSNIYPLRAIKIVAPASLVLNQGADTIRVGQRFSANVLGDMTMDPYTKEPLGRAETPIGTVQISRVDPKLSYGDLVNGALPGGEPEIILRAIDESAREPDAAASKNKTGARPKW